MTEAQGASFGMVSEKRTELSSNRQQKRALGPLRRAESRLPVQLTLPETRGQFNMTKIARRG